MGLFAGESALVRVIKKRVFMQIFSKTASKTKFLIVQGNFGKFIDVVRRKFVLFKSLPH